MDDPTKSQEDIFDWHASLIREDRRFPGTFSIADGTAKLTGSGAEFTKYIGYEEGFIPSGNYYVLLDGGRYQVQRVSEQELRIDLYSGADFSQQSIQLEQPSGEVISLPQKMSYTYNASDAGNGFSRLKAKWAHLTDIIDYIPENRYG